MRPSLTLALATWLLPIAALAAQPVGVSDAWARASIPGQTVGSAYMTLQSRDDRTLTGIASPAAGSVEIHQMSMRGNVMKMRMMSTLPLPAGKPVQLAPGGLHLMLFDLKKPLKAGDRLTLTLQIRDQRGQLTTQTLQMPVREIKD